MAEWTNARVCKIRGRKAYLGSNPSPSTNMEKPESIEVSGNIVPNIFKMNSEQNDHLKREVEASGHKIRIIVHPFYQVEDYSEADTPAFLRLLKSTDSRRIPTLIFEEYYKCERYHTNHTPDTSGTSLYLVPTQTGAPHPRVESQDGWNMLIKVLKEAGTEEIILGGRFVNYQDEMDGVANYQKILKQKLEEQGLKLEYTLGECVGITGGILAEAGFNIQLSNLTFPLKISRHHKN